MNLKALRETGLDDEMIRVLNFRKYWFPDQDVLNEKCMDAIKEIDGDYNGCDYVTHTMDPKIVHYAAVKGYQNLERFEDYRKRDWPVRKGGQ